MDGIFIFKYKKVNCFLIMVLLYFNTYSFGSSNLFISNWTKPDYNESLKPDLETIKRIGRLYFAMKKNNRFYSWQDFENDLSYLEFPKEDIKYLKNIKTFTFINNYVKKLSTLESGIPEYEVFLD